MSLKFYLTDVFTTTKYSGNQLATIIVDSELPESKMLKIAREFNFSETTFVIAPKADSNSFKTRIFTPASEIPFAGHPTLGTAFLLHKFYSPNTNKITLELPVGNIPVNLSSNTLWMTQNKAEYLEFYSKEAIASLLNIDEDEIRTDLPIQRVSTGLPALIIPLKNLNAVKKTKPIENIYNKLFNGKNDLTLYVFSEETYSNENDLNARVFFNAFGIREDPATGSATGCLGGYLSKHLNRNINISVEQGFEIDRKSVLKLNVTNNIIKVGGKVSLTAKGELL